MQVKTQVSYNESEKVYQKFVSITGFEHWKRRSDDLRKQETHNPLLKQLFGKRYYIERRVSDIMEHYKKTGRYGLLFNSATDCEIIEMACFFNQIHENLSDRGKSRIVGMVHDALKTDKGLAPLLFEFRVAIHYMHEGYDVQFHDVESNGVHDVESNGGFDYLVSKDGYVFEVECKNVSGDIGQPIHALPAYRLAGRFQDAIEIFEQKNSGFTLIEIQINGRLHKTDSFCLPIVQRLHDFLQSDEHESAHSDFTFRKTALTDQILRKIPDPGITDPKKMFLRVADQLTTHSVRHLIISSQTQQTTTLVALTSTQEHSIFKNIVEQIKKSAKRQFSMSRPGIVWVYLSDFPEEYLQLLLNEENYSDINLIFSKISHASWIGRNHILCLNFALPRTIQHASFTGNESGLCRQMTGHRIHYKNPNFTMETKN